MRLLYPLITLTDLIYIHERTKLQLSIYSLLDCYTTDQQYSLRPAQFKTFVPVLQALIRTSHPKSDNPSYTATYQHVRPNAPEAWHQAHPEVSGESID